MYFRTCELCGANLDPGERCDCEKEKGLCLAVTQPDKKDLPVTQIPFDLILAHDIRKSKRKHKKGGNGIVKGLG